MRRIKAYLRMKLFYPLVLPFLLLAASCSFAAARLGMAFGIMAALPGLTGFSVHRFFIRLGLGIRFALTMLRLCICHIRPR